ncbi:MAG: cell division protein FtsA [Terriglobales bacterium]
MTSPLPAPFNILDLGTARTTLLQVQLVEGRMRYAGHVTAPSQGLRKGSIVALASAADGVHAVVAALERRTGAPVERVFLSLTGAHVRGVTSQAGLALTSRSREVTREDASRALDLARTIALPDDRQIIHVVPQEFVLDRQAGIHEPVGMLASRLEARIYAITVSTGVKDNLVLAANHAGVEVQELIFAPLAAAEACLVAEDRFAGVAVLDLGAGSTGVLIYSQGSLAHAAVIPIGGDHFTNDIAIGLNTPPAEAERIKCAFGGAAASYVSESSAIEVPRLGESTPRLLPLRRLCECIEPRARELVRLIQAEVARAGGLGAGIILAGGAGRLPGLREMIAAATSLHVRFASPVLIEGMPDELDQPEFAFTVGACYYAHRLLSRQLRPPTLWEKLRHRWSALLDS